MMSLRRRLTAKLPPWLRALLRHVRDGSLLSPHARVSFAQEGEDLLLARMFEHKRKGFYVDVGAHHPTRFSNTRLLHDRGWRGINIDATPGSMDPFRRARPDDINLEVAVSSDARHRRLYLFDDPALNTLSEELSGRRNRTTDYQIAAAVEMPTRTLGDILTEHLPQEVDNIDLMTIDVEGHDLDVLRSNDWSRFRPRVLLIEILNSTIEDLPDRDEIVFLRRHGYHVFGKLMNSVVLTLADAQRSGESHTEGRT